MRTHKVITDSQGNDIRICGTNKWQIIHQSYHEESFPFIYHYGRQYKLDEFMSVRRSFGSHPDWLKEFDGYCNDSFFSGVLIKLSDCGESAKVFTFIS